MLQTNLSSGTPRETSTVYPRRSKQPRRDRGRTLANSLGWFSVGLGLAELIAPGRISKTIGLCDDRRSRSAMRAMGARELVTGIGILAGSRRGPWLWARVGGDIVDLALLRSAMRARINDGARVSAALSAIAGVAALDALVARRVSKAERAHGVGLEQLAAVAVTTINRPPHEVYAFFRDFQNLPSFMANVESIEVHGERNSHWKVRGPGGFAFEWDAELFDDRPDQLIAWRSLPGADVENHGRVRFERAPGGRGTEIHAEIHYHPPAGRLGVAIASLFGSTPGQQAQADLNRLKQVLETGEVLHSDSSIHRGMHAATPPTERFIERHTAEIHRQPLSQAQVQAQASAHDQTPPRAEEAAQ